MQPTWSRPSGLVAQLLSLKFQSQAVRADARLRAAFAAGGGPFHIAGDQAGLVFGVLGLEGGMEVFGAVKT